LEGEWLGKAVQSARQEVDGVRSADWGDYLDYGAYEFALKPANPRLDTSRPFVSHTAYPAIDHPT
jgi:hypothetical protein